MKQRLCCSRTESCNSFFYHYLLIFVGRGGTLVDSMPLDRKVVGSNPILAATPPGQQKFRAMNGAHLASPIRGDLGYAHRPHLGSQIHCPIGNQIWGTLGKEGVCPNFTLYGWANLCSAIRATLGQRQIRQSPGLPLNAHSGNDWGPIPVLTGSQISPHNPCPKIISLAKNPSTHPLQNSISYNTLQTSQPSYIRQLLTIQPPGSTRSSSYLSLSRPPVSSSASSATAHLPTLHQLFGTDSH